MVVLCVLFVLTSGSCGHTRNDGRAMGVVVVVAVVVAAAAVVVAVVVDVVVVHEWPSSWS